MTEEWYVGGLLTPDTAMAENQT